MAFWCFWFVALDAYRMRATSDPLLRSAYQCRQCRWCMPTVFFSQHFKGTLKRNISLSSISNSKFSNSKMFHLGSQICKNKMWLVTLYWTFSHQVPMASCIFVSICLGPLHCPTRKKRFIAQVNAWRFEIPPWCTCAPVQLQNLGRKDALPFFYTYNWPFPPAVSSAEGLTKVVCHLLVSCSGYALKHGWSDFGWPVETWNC